MTTIRSSSSRLLILALLPLMVIGCQLEIGSQPAPTPLPPATPLPPDTPVPPPTPLPTVIQRQERGYTLRLCDSEYAPWSPRPLAKLVLNSTVIVIGTVPDDDAESIRVQDRSNPSVQSVGSGFTVQVERYLKGSGGDTIPVVQFTGIDFRDRGQIRQARDKNEKLLLDEGSRYLLFLKENESYPGY